MAPSTATTKSLQQKQQQHHHHLPLLQVQCEALLCAALEHWAHDLLYVRHVYPRQVFIKSNVTFIGIKNCRVCRHPAVVSYISNSITTAVPTMLLCGNNNISSNSSNSFRDNVALSLTILDIDDDDEGNKQNQKEDGSPAAQLVERETYTLRVLEMLSPQEWRDYDAACSRKHSSGSNNNNAAAIHQSSSHSSHNDLIHLMERKLRDLVLQVHSLESSSKPSWTNHVTFRISLFLPQRFMLSSTLLSKRCSSLFQNLTDGTCRVANDDEDNNHNVNDDDSCAHTKTCKARVLRPLYRMSTPLWCMDFSLQYHKRQQQYGKRRRRNAATSSVVAAAALLPTKLNENDNGTITTT